MKSQMKAADRSGARFAIIVGGDEVAAGTVTVRPWWAPPATSAPRPPSPDPISSTT